MSRTSKAAQIAWVAILSAVCIASRVYLQFLPNIKPVTSIVIVVTQLFGAVAGFELVTTVVLVSGMLLGVGPWIISQLVAWYAIVFIAVLTRKFSKNVYTMGAVSFVCGYVFGFLVSTERLLYGVPVFITYWVAGLFFDTLHAVGNIAFYQVCYFVITKALKVSGYHAKDGTSL